MIGVKPVNGLLFLINRASPEYKAQELWGRKPDKSELPQLQ